jgi:hypothetical protein
VLVVAVWWERDHVDGFRARVSTVGGDGHMLTLGVTTERAQTVEIVRQWLEPLGGG